MEWIQLGHHVFEGSYIVITMYILGSCKSNFLHNFSRLHPGSCTLHHCGVIGVYFC